MSQKSTSPAPRSFEETTFGANEVRLGPRDWLLTLGISAVALLALPMIWKQVEKMPLTETYRVPFDLSDDYWVYRRQMDATTESDVILIGDSVVWGEYATPSQTLAAALTRTDDAHSAVNGGLNGTHPLALEGLVRYHAPAIRNRRVILHFNPLWLSSPERDLRAVGDTTFNHPDLIPQFWPRIPAYQADTNQRLGLALDRYQPHQQLAKHLRVAWFGSQDIPTWCVEHPDANALNQIQFLLPGPSQQPRHVGRRAGPVAQPPSWQQAGITPQDFPWMQLDSSLQWPAFERTVELLQHRGNRVLVLVGPFNTHLLTAPSRQRYEHVLEEITTRLSQQQIEFIAPRTLPSILFGDASHPLPEGYTMLAQQIVESVEYQAWRP